MLNRFFTLLTLLVLVSVFCSVSGAAPCPGFEFTAPEKISLKNTSALIVTHPSSIWDGHLASKIGVDAAVMYAKRRSIPVVYLASNESPETYFFSDCRPNFWVLSSEGEFTFNLDQVNHIYSVGGHWELCQLRTQLDIMKAWRLKRNVDLTFTQVLDGLYTFGHWVTKADSYYDDHQRFMEIIGYRKPTDNPASKWKMSMLQLMGVIRDPAKEIEYLKRNLPRYSEIDSQYEVQLIYNGKLIEVLRKGKASKAPVLKIEFVDSLYESGHPPGIFSK